MLSGGVPGRRTRQRSDRLPSPPFVMGQGFLQIIKAEHRGQGIDLKRRAAMGRLGDHMVSLDGVVAQEENYRKSKASGSPATSASAARAAGRRPRASPALPRSRSRKSCVMTGSPSRRRAPSSSPPLSRTRKSCRPWRRRRRKATGLRGLEGVSGRFQKSGRSSPTMRRPPNACLSGSPLALPGAPVFLDPPEANPGRRRARLNAFQMARRSSRRRAL